MVVNLNLKYDINSEAFDSFSQIDRVNYIICSTPRSGSTLLAEGLKSTQVAGNPHEYFNIDHQSDYHKRWNFKSVQEYITLLKKNRATSNGVFGFKIHFNQFAKAFKEEPLEGCFSDLKFIFLTRSNKIAQGISLEIAYQTNQWSSNFNKDKKAKFNFKDIKKRVDNISSQETNWKNYFDENNIEPLVLDYDNLELNYEISIKKVLNFLDLDYQKPIPPMQLKKQRNLVNSIWKIKYKWLNIIK